MALDMHDVMKVGGVLITVIVPLVVQTLLPRLGGLAKIRAELEVAQLTRDNSDGIKGVTDARIREYLRKNGVAARYLRSQMNQVWGGTVMGSALIGAGWGLSLLRGMQTLALWAVVIGTLGVILASLLAVAVVVLDYRVKQLDSYLAVKEPAAIPRIWRALRAHQPLENPQSVSIVNVTVNTYHGRT